MWNRKELKAKGKAAFKANYLRCVLVAFILALIVGGSVAGSSSGASELTAEQQEALAELANIQPEVVLTVLGVMLAVFVVIFLIAALISAFLFNPLNVDCNRFFLDNSESPASMGVLGSSYKKGYWNAVKALLLRDVFLELWSMLFLIPGIIKSYSYRLVPYIMAENPTMGAREAITLSRNMMNGQKWNAFLLDLSFFGWYIVTVLTLGLGGFFYVFPWVYATDAELYKAIKAGYTAA